jgi:predicted NBD/HSP70 family sugar kinase
MHLENGTHGSIGVSPGALLQLLRDGTPRSRADLVRVTGLSRSTVNSRIDVLLELGLVAPYGEGRSTGGRPPTEFAFDGAAHGVLGVALGASHATIALTDLFGVVQGSYRQRLDIDLGPEAVLGWVRQHGHRMLQECGRTLDWLIGVGVGVPGPVDFSTGRPVSPPIMPGWEGFDIPATLREAFHAPVVVDNDVNVLAISEHRTYWNSVQNLLFVKAATGIGSGIIAGGQVQRGALGAAGDLGHIVADPESGVTCRCGNTGCLEAVASAAALARRLIGDGVDAVDTLLERAKQGDSAIAGEVREAGRKIGAVVASAVSLLNPEVVVIGGSLVAAREPFLVGFREAVYSKSLPLATRDLILSESRMHDMGGVRGASFLSIESTLASAAVDARIADSETGATNKAPMTSALSAIE